MAEKPAPSAVESSLGIDEIQDAEKREIVKTYFEKTLTPEQREGLIHEKARSDISKLRQQIRSLNERRASAEEFVQEIISTMQRDVVERDLNDGYTDSSGAHTGYIEQYFKMAGTDIHDSTTLSALEQKYKDDSTNEKHMDWDDRATFDHCLNRVKAVVRAIPLNVKREVRHRFVVDFITKYVDTIDYFDSWMENFDSKEIPDMEKKFAADYPYLQSFELWLAQNGLKMEESVYQYSKLDTKAIVETKSRLEAAKKSITAYPKAQQDYYTQQIQNIEGLALNNPAQAQEQLASLEKDMATLATFVAMGTDIGGARSKYNEFKAKYPDFDGKFLAQIDDLQKKYDDRMKQLDAEKDLVKRSSLMDVSDLKKTKDQIDFDMIKASEEAAKKADEAKKTTDAQAAETAAAEAEDKPGFLDSAVLGDSKLGKIVKDLATKVPLVGGFILSAFLAPSTLKKLGISAPTDLSGFFKANNIQKTPEQLKQLEAKARQLLKDQLKIESVDEMEILSKTTVKDFIKAKPEKFDQKHYDALVMLLKKNGATETTDKKVFEFILLKVEEWKS